MHVCLGVSVSWASQWGGRCDSLSVRGASALSCKSTWPGTLIHGCLNGGTICSFLWDPLTPHLTPQPPTDNPPSWSRPAPHWPPPCCLLASRVGGEGKEREGGGEE